MPTMVKRCRCSREETRVQIVEKADEFFHKYGIDRTTVADIASALGMSSANVYKFFPTKRALIEATAYICLAELRETLEKAIRSRRNTVGRIEAMVLALYDFNCQQNKFDYEFYRFVVRAYQEEWDCVRNFDAMQLKVMTELLEDGNKTGDIRLSDPALTAKILLDSVEWVINPVLLYQLEGQDVRARVRAQVQFFEKALR